MTMQREDVGVSEAIINRLERQVRDEIICPKRRGNLVSRLRDIFVEFQSDCETDHAVSGSAGGLALKEPPPDGETCHKAVKAVRKMWGISASKLKKDEREPVLALMKWVTHALVSEREV